MRGFVLWCAMACAVPGAPACMPRASRSCVAWLAGQSPEQLLHCSGGQLCIIRALVEVWCCHSGGCSRVLLAVTRRLNQLKAGLCFNVPRGAACRLQSAVLRTWGIHTAFGCQFVWVHACQAVA